MAYNMKILLKKAKLTLKREGIGILIQKTYSKIIWKFKQVKKKYKKPFIHKTVIIWGKKNVKLSKGAHLWEYSIIRARSAELIVRENSHIGPFTVIFTAEHGVHIGSNVMIAPHCVIAGGSHNYKNIEKPMLFSDDFSKGPIIINDDVWIGANTTILDAVEIGEGAIIGANSLVNKNVKPYDIVAGNPAKKIGSRLKYK